MGNRRRLTAVPIILVLTFILGATLPQARAETTEFGYNGARSSSTYPSSIIGSQFTCPTTGTAQSISVDITLNPEKTRFGNDNTGSYTGSITNIIRGGSFQSPGYTVVAQNIEAYITSQGTSNIKAAIYASSNPSTPIASTEEKAVTSGTNWTTFSFPEPKPALKVSTAYVLVVWSNSGTGTAYLQHSSISGGNGRYTGTIGYGNWPQTQTFQTNSYQYSIRCNYIPAPIKVKAAIYDHDSRSLIGSTEEKTLAAGTDGWVTFNLNPKRVLTASTTYIITAWASEAGLFKMWYTSTGASSYQSHTATTNYGNWPEKPSFVDIKPPCKYNIFCTLQYSYSIYASATSGGRITPGSATVNHGSSQTFTITADPGHTISAVSVDGSPVGPVTSYSFTDVQSDHTISASFADPPFEAPEYELGALLALVACFAAFVTAKRRVRHYT